MCNDEKKHENTLSSGKVAQPAEQLKLVKVNRIKNLILSSKITIQTFVKYMDDNSKLRNMIETGKGNLQWERDIPADALANLQQLAQTNFRNVYGISLKNNFTK